MRVCLVLIVLAACSNDSPVTPDATEPDAAAADALPDVAAAACLALDPPVIYFGAGDCIDHAQATVRWDGNLLTFPYPTRSGANYKRYVTGSYDTSATLNSAVTQIHVDVTTWQEGDGVHTIDIVITFTGSGVSLPPLHVKGTFCDWPYYIC